jgi:hypothetical protein
MNLGLKITVSWDVTPCNFVNCYPCFGGKSRIGVSVDEGLDR